MPTITVKFTDESYKIIKNYLDQHEIKKNQFVKNAIALYVAMTGSSKALLESDPATKDFFKGIKKIVNSKEYQQQVNELLIKLSQKYPDEELKLLCSGFSELEEKKKTLEKKNDPGPKPKPKRRPGHPPTYE